LSSWDRYQANQRPQGRTLTTMSHGDGSVCSRDHLQPRALTVMPGETLRLER
jgi:hypothetical protein